MRTLFARPFDSLQLRFTASALAAFNALACAAAPQQPMPRCEASPALVAPAGGATVSNAPTPALAAPNPVVATPPASARGKVALAIVIDQLPAWVGVERFPQLPNGGFARLRREGTWVKSMSYLHASTETAPGHASLFSGRAPREHRIVGNAVWRTDLKRAGSLLEDASAHLIGPDGTDAKSVGVSLANVRGPLLADALRERDPEAVVVAVSLKDRGAVFAGGRQPNAAVWYNEVTGKLSTSTAFSKDGKLPAFSQPYGVVVQPNTRISWPIFDRAFVEAHQQTPDDQPGESLLGTTRNFPHTFSEQNAFNGYRLTPNADALLVDLAVASLSLRKPDHPMLLAVSFSTNDLVGHSYGPNSWEAWSQLAALDSMLARLFQALDVALGPEGYAVVLGADHGIVPIPEFVKLKRPEYCTLPDYYERPCVPGVRVQTANLQKLLNTGLQKALGLKDPPVMAIVDSRLVLSDSVHALPAAQQKAFDQVLRVLIRQDPSVAEVFALADFKDDCPPPPDESLRALVCRANTESVSSGYYDIPGDYYVVLKPGHFWGFADGVGHGAPYRYDRSVPMLVRYPGGPRERIVDQAWFGSYYASLWYALTGEVTSGPYGSVVGAR